MELGILSTVYIVAEELENNSLDNVSYSSTIEEAQASKQSLLENGFSNLVILKQTIEVVE